MSSCINLGINVNICDDGGLHLIRNVEKICHLVNVNTPCIHKYSDVDNFYTVFWLQEKQSCQNPINTQLCMTSIVIFRD